MLLGQPGQQPSAGHCRQSWSGSCYIQQSLCRQTACLHHTMYPAISSWGTIWQQFLLGRKQPGGGGDNELNTNRSQTGDTGHWHQPAVSRAALHWSPGVARQSAPPLGQGRNSKFKYRLQVRIAAYEPLESVLAPLVASSRDILCSQFQLFTQLLARQQPATAQPAAQEVWTRVSQIERVKM